MLTIQEENVLMLLSVCLSVEIFMITHETETCNQYDF